jgi:hypothetical protein
VNEDHRYHALFDAAAVVGVDLVLDEKYHPCAGAALRTWAETRHKSVMPRDAEGWPAGAVSVSLPVAGTPGGRTIDVYLR